MIRKIARGWTPHRPPANTRESGTPGLFFFQGPPGTRQRVHSAAECAAAIHFAGNAWQVDGLLTHHFVPLFLAHANSFSVETCFRVWSARNTPPP